MTIISAVSKINIMSSSRICSKFISASANVHVSTRQIWMKTLVPSTSVMVSVPNAAIASHSPASVVPLQGQRFFSSQDEQGSHADFTAKKKTVPTPEEAMKLIDKHVKENKIMLYMKGSPSQPMCGFSAKVVQVLKESDADFASVNVLDYPAIREGVKTYSAWPTIPQLYIDGEFVGGCDIVTSMHESGELKELIVTAMSKKEN